MISSVSSLRWTSVAPQRSHVAGHLGRLGDEVIARAAARAGAALRDAIDELLDGRVEHEDGAEGLAGLRQHAAERLGLRDGARKAVEQEAARRVGLREPVGDDVRG